MQHFPSLRKPKSRSFDHKVYNQSKVSGEIATTKAIKVGVHEKRVYKIPDTSYDKAAVALSSFATSAKEVCEISSGYAYYRGGHVIVLYE